MLLRSLLVEEDQGKEQYNWHDQCENVKVLLPPIVLLWVVRVIHHLWDQFSQDSSELSHKYRQCCSQESLVSAKPQITHPRHPIQNERQSYVWDDFSSDFVDVFLDPGSNDWGAESEDEGGFVAVDVQDEDWGEEHENHASCIPVGHVVIVFVLFRSLGGCLNGIE